ncbi:hypothetical protein EW145_g2340 [Phellinidium pouzarii]|uniref:Core domain-containing protein n=1 Tax=Phellinidium pouzarii TaxID=167371 RepID=A0A4S4LD62_9AGAM|nr:hypothetical protein EW145_g2340 [Phellinidium pouzarii]
MSTAARLRVLRPFLATSSTQCICRRTPLSDTSHSTPSRSRLLYTTRPLRASLATSASASLPSTSTSSSQSPSAAAFSAASSTAAQKLSGEASAPARRVSPGLLLGTPCEILRLPTEEDLEAAEVNAEVLPPAEARLLLTESAAEQLRRIAIRENDPNVALRITIESGGCHGYQYKMDLTSELQLDDYLFSHPTLKPSNVIVDAISLPLLKNSTLDYATELIGSSFRISENPQAKNGCGCGVSWELKL